MRPWEAKGSVGLAQVFGAGGADLCQKACLRMITGVMILEPPGRRRNWRAGCGRADGAETQVCIRSPREMQSEVSPRGHHYLLNTQAEAQESRRETKEWVKKWESDQDRS